jgi:outer membrane protein with beta-barrel domain
MKNVLRIAAALGLLLTSSAALAQGRATARSSSGLTNMGVLVGFEDGGPESGLALRGDVEFMPTRIAPNANLSLVMSAGFTRFSDGFWYANDVREEWSWNLFKLIPAARFSFDVAPRFGLYGDAGLGLYVGTFSWQHDYRYAGYTEDYSNTELGVAMRLAAGAKFLVTPTFQLGAELGVNPYFAGDYDDTTLSAMLLASFRL